MKGRIFSALPAEKDRFMSVLIIVKSSIPNTAMEEPLELLRKLQKKGYLASSHWLKPGLGAVLS